MLRSDIPPTTTIECPGHVVAGEPLKGTVHVELDGPRVAVDTVSVRLTGALEHRRQHGAFAGPIHITSLATPPTLQAGAHSWPFAVSLPATSPPSYEGKRVSMRYEIEARFETERGGRPSIDRRDIVVFVGRDDRTARPTRLFSDRSARPDLEVQVESYNVAAGTRVKGAVAIANVSGPRVYEGIELILRRDERVMSGPARNRVAQHATEWRSKHVIPLADCEEGQVVPFEVAVPREAQASYSGDAFSILWTLRVTGLKRWRRDPHVEIPLTVVPPWQSVRRLATADVMMVGPDRVAEMCEAVATKRDLSAVGAKVFGAIAGAELRVERHVDIEQGPRLVGEVRYSDLGLQLSITPEDRRAKLKQRDIVLGANARWDRRHRVTCRDPDQLEPFAVELAPALAAFEHVTMDDERLTAVVPVATAAFGITLDELVDSLSNIAWAVRMGQPKIPPPHAMAPYVPAWHSLAGELGGTLHVATMTVHAVVGGMDARIWTTLDPSGEPSATKIRIAPPDGLGVDVEFEDDGDQVAMWIDPDSVTLAYPAPHPAPLRLAGRAREIQQEVARILAVSRNAPPLR